ncbi:MAG: hypothetical protein PVI77_18905, partial [Desulfobacterales bacterium]
MQNALFWIAAIAGIVQTFIALTYFISSIWEKERRASMFGGLQFLAMLAMLILLFYLYSAGFFYTTAGVIVLILVIIFGALTAASLMMRLGANAKALQGTMGLIVGEVKRQDEREIMFARNRSLRPDSEQYKQFYKIHPDYEEYDAARREKGGPLGRPGTIDKPHERPNVAATFASLSIPLFLSTPEKFEPHAFPIFPDQPQELTSD